jgi:hypothetical protein
MSLVCIEKGDPELGDCTGSPSEHSSLTGASVFVRCDGHYEKYVERTQPRLDAVNARYPDSSFAPDWFDPTYAGEHWDSDY